MWNSQVNAKRPQWWSVSISSGDGLVPSGNKHYLGWYWPGSKSPYGVNMSKWINIIHRCRAEFFWENINNFRISLRPSRLKDSWNLLTGKTKIYRLCKSNIMAAGGLATEGIRALAAMHWTNLPGIFRSLQKRVNLIRNTSRCVVQRGMSLGGIMRSDATPDAWTSFTNMFSPTMEQ